MKRLLLALIRGYRTYISPSRPPCCRFIPTCSAYALEAVEKYGARQAAGMPFRGAFRGPFALQPPAGQTDGPGCHAPARSGIEGTALRPPSGRTLLSMPVMASRPTGTAYGRHPVARCCNSA